MWWTKIAQNLIDNSQVTPVTNQILPEQLAAKKRSKKLITKKVEATAYCSCKKCCGAGAIGKTKSGTTPVQGRTIAVPMSIPLGTPVTIKELGRTYIAEDTGGAIRGNRIDVYFNNHRDALNFGRKPVTISYYA